MKKNETTHENLPSSFKILKLIENETQTAPKLRTISALSKATIYRCLITLENSHLVQKLGKSPALYSITARGKIALLRIIKHTKSRTKSHKVSLPSLRHNEKKTRVHALAIKYPLLEDNFTGEWHKVVSSFKNSLKKYMFIPEAKVTIEKTSKSIILHIHKKTIDPRELLSGYYEWLRIVEKIAYFHLLKKGIKFDVFSPKVIRQHIATNAEEFEEKAGKGTIEVALGRKAKSYFPSSMDAKAWLDRSNGLLEIESNDLTYKEKLALLPEFAFETNNHVFALLGNFDTYNESLKEYSKNIKMHMSVMKNMNKTLKEMRNTMRNDKQ